MRLCARYLRMLRILPEHSMFDEKVSILAQGLQPSGRVTLSIKVDHQSGQFGSEAHFVADTDGNLNLATQESLGGSYKGCTSRLPGLIDMFGTAGGLLQHRSALLSSHGFVVFSLAFFNYEDLPESAQELDIDYFEEAADWLSKHENVLPGGVGIVGVSLGADIVAMTAIVSPIIKAAVWLNGGHMLDAYNPMTYKGKPWPVEESDFANLVINNGVLNYRSFKETVPTKDELVFPVETSKNANFLLFACEDDQNVSAIQSAHILVDRFKRAGKTNFELEIYPKAGHLLEPPFMPHIGVGWHKVLGCQMMWGGEPSWHNEAQEKSWLKMREFLAKHLGPPADIPRLTHVLNKSRL